MKTIKIKTEKEKLNRTEIIHKLKLYSKKFKLNDEIIFQNQSTVIEEENYTALNSYILNPFNKELSGEIAVIFSFSDNTFYGKRENINFERMKKIKQNLVPSYINKDMNKTQKIFYILCNRILMYNGFDYYSDFILSKNSYYHSLLKVFDVHDLSKYIMKISKDLTTQDKKDFIDIFKNKEEKIKNIKYFFENSPIEYNVYCYKNKDLDVAIYIIEEFIHSRNVKVIMSLSVSIAPIPVFFSRSINIKIIHNTSKIIKVMDKINNTEEFKKEIKLNYKSIDWQTEEKKITKFVYETKKFLSYYRKNPPTQEIIESNLQFKLLEHSDLFSSNSLSLYFKDSFENKDLEISSKELSDIIMQQTIESEDV